MLRSKSLAQEISEFNNTQNEDCQTFTFLGVDGYDVYNPSIIIEHQGFNYMFGRVEKRNEWASSKSCLFKQISTNTFELVKTSLEYLIEDPYVTIINNEYIMGGTYVHKDDDGTVLYFYAKFYRGLDLFNLQPFFEGPHNMKDIRLVALNNNKIGVFSRPRGAHIQAQYGVDSLVGFTTINSLDKLSISLIENAIPIENLFAKDEWGGVNQAYVLNDKQILLLAHRAYLKSFNRPVYTCYYYIYEYQTNTIKAAHLLATRSNFKPGPTKIAIQDLSDVCFTAGLYLNDNKTYLISGINDCEVGLIKIDNILRCNYE